MMARNRADEDAILFDTGATSHMFKRREDFAVYERLSEEMKVTVGNGQVVMGIAQGETLLRSSTGERIRLKQVLHVPALTTNVLSGTKIMMNESLSMQCNSHGVMVKKNANRELEQPLQIARSLHFVRNCVTQKRCSQMTHHNFLND